jgi:uncharacterized protein
VTAGQMQLARSGEVILSRVLRADSFFERTRGLLGRSSPAEGAAMLFPGCRSIHTVGMAYSIDLVFLDRQESIVGLRPVLKPYRLTLCRKAVAALELACGEIERLGLKLGDQLLWQQQ